MIPTSEILALVNGSPVGALSALDRGLAFGDGVFRTLRLVAGQPVWWSDHFQKLDTDCARLGLVNPSRTEWEQDIAWIAVRMPDASLRLTVTRGPGPRGYRLPELPVPSRITIASPLPAGADPVAVAGATVRICGLRLGHQPRLAGVKHLNRLENVLARMEWEDPDIHEGILLDQDDQVISGVMSNLFILSDGHLVTPALDRCGVAGVTRARLIHLARGLGMAVEERRVELGKLLQADGVLLTNSLIRAWSVVRLEERTWLRHPALEILREKLCSDV